MSVQADRWRRPPPPHLGSVSQGKAGRQWSLSFNQRLVAVTARSASDGWPQVGYPTEDRRALAQHGRRWGPHDPPGGLLERADLLEPALSQRAAAGPRTGEESSALARRSREEGPTV